MRKIISIAVLISGNGKTLQNFIDCIKSGSLPAKIQIVISSNPDAKGLERAKINGIPTAVVSRSSYKDVDSFSEAITKKLKEYPVELITLAGFMHLYKIPDTYSGRVMNVHPGLIPAFCGHGYYGHKVHEAVIRYGAKVSGCTVHFADNVYDNGPIIIQRTTPVFVDDTPDTLAERVFKEECTAYPEAIRLFAEGRLKREGRRIIILKKE
ncbi:phosphoribosylglycinamide formyltransferase [Candidatus Kuenenia sp.]|uniref:phosphoribosylglycinamide formyltransferase n=1 Tax=Candidatus Kuenenia sp. TaxID=2499824 RepID=UPI00321FDB3E